MITRCPYSDCRNEWDLDEAQASPVVVRASNGFFKGRCPRCQRKITIKPIEIWQSLERKIVYLGGKGCLQSESWSWSAGEDRGLADLPELHVVLEDIRSLHNVGSIFRTADAFGFGRIHLCGITGTPDRKDVKKTSLSAESHIKWKYHMSGAEAIEQLRKAGGKIIALERCDESHDISEIDLRSYISQPLALVLGNEVSGVSEELIEQSDLICHIPMQGMKESLNVAVAFGVAAFTIANSLRKAATG